MNLIDQLQQEMQDNPVVDAIAKGIGFTFGDMKVLDGEKIHNFVPLPSCLAVLLSDLNEDESPEWTWEEGYALIFVGVGRANAEKLLYYIGAENDAEMVVRYGELMVYSGISVDRIQHYLVEVKAS